MGTEIKEGVVLDREEDIPPQQDASTPGHVRFSAQPNVRVFRGGWGLVALLAIGIPLILVAGLVIFGVALAGFFVFWLIRMLLGSPSGPGRSVVRR